MGFYIQGPTTGKADFLIREMHGVEIPQPTSFSSIPEDKALICVVRNPVFDAAGFCYDEREFIAFTSETDYRPKRWIVIDKNIAKKESGYNGQK